MDIEILTIEDPIEKSGYAEKILRRLPEWFGNEKGLTDYIKGVRELPFLLQWTVMTAVLDFFQ
jgi:hypothetical protein